MRRLFLIVLLMAAPAAAQDPVPGLKVPPGFVVTQFADHTLANDIYCMTIDPKGRIVVSGRGYIKILVDDDNDGKADRVLDFADSPRDGAMGLFWEKDTLYVTGDGGLRRFVDKDGDGKADGPSELIRKIKTGGEHAAHAVKRGPDGWLYVLCGDGAGIDKTFASLPTSPIKDPVGGCVIRFPPDFKGSEVVAHGFRNAYGMDFDHHGDLYTYDSDNERCLNLPWYEPTRFYHVIDGGFYGWLAPQRAKFWRMPPYFYDVMAPAAYLGRGSPTGVIASTAFQFPWEYQLGLFALDWTFGKVYFVKPNFQNVSRPAKSTVFLESIGNDGFAPTAGAIHPLTGDLFLSVGGRGTRGGVYRVRHTAGFERSRGTQFEMVPRRLDIRSMDNTELDPLGLRPWKRLLVAQRFPGDQKPGAVARMIEFHWNTRDPLLRQTVINTLKIHWELLTPEEKENLREKADRPSRKLVLAAALLETEPETSLALVEPLLDPDVHPWVSLAAVRVLQKLTGDLVAPGAKGTFREGYSRRQVELPKFFAGPRLKDLTTRLISLGDASEEMTWEVPRTLALLGPDLSGDQLIRVLDRDGDAVREMHLAMCLASFPNEPKTALYSAAGMALRAEKMLKAEGKTFELNGPLRLKEVMEAAVSKYPELMDRIVTPPGLFGQKFGDSEHLIFTDIKTFPRRTAARAFIKRLDEEPDFPLTPSLIQLLGELPPEDIVLRARRWWEDPSLRPALLPILAKAPQAEDYPRFVEGIKTGGPSLVDTCLQALKKLPLQKDIDGGEPYALFRAIAAAPEKTPRLKLDLYARLALVTGEDHGQDLDAWRRWFRKTHPKLAARLENPDGVDVAAWAKRLGKIDWDRGDAGRGQKVFGKASCIQCHGGSSAVGPDLAGAAGRFSRADLFTAIVQPSRDVADRYRMTHVETREGKVYQGLVIYDAVDSLLLHTREGTTVRLVGGEVDQRRQVDISPMPAGLLDGLSDAEIADLYAYLRKK